MTSPRKRQVRLIVSLALALALASGLVYTSFAASNPALTPTQLLREGHSGGVYQLTGTVVRGSVVSRSANTIDFRVADRGGRGDSVAVAYSGTVPDPFRQGREVIVTGSLRGHTFVGQPNSLITKCPSKYSAAPTTKT